MASRADTRIWVLIFFSFPVSQIKSYGGTSYWSSNGRGLELGRGFGLKGDGMLSHSQRKDGRTQIRWQVIYINDNITAMF